MNKPIWKLPRYKVLRNIITQDIAVGKYPPGSELPSTRELCGMYHVSHNTVELAISLLAGEKLIRRRRGCRAKVLAPHKKSNLWIAIVDNNPEGDILSDYQESPWQWTISNEITCGLLRSGNVALQLSLCGSWMEHLSKVDGIVIVKSNAVASKLQNLNDYGLPEIPCVFIDPRSVPAAENTIKLDYSSACRQIATYFLVNGVEHFLVHDIIDSDWDCDTEYCRFQEFYRTLAENSVPESSIHKLHMLDSVTSDEQLLAVIEEKLKSLSGRIGVLWSRDIIAAKVCKMAASCGRTLKKDLFVAGISGLPELYSTTPALSSIKVPFADIAGECLNMLYDMIGKKIEKMPGRVYNLKFCPRDT
ncbi:MAG: GntR family transcriptional regulator [Lentisphaerae bacterium]|nr:GntR family transcriptional regulator [Lentisphaerota bacterium]